MENTVQTTIPIQTSSAITVRLPVYEGPLDLLLDLIKKNEVNIYDIPVAEITRQYLDYLGQMKEMNLDIAGEFLVMAATLLYIKSKMLLPVETEEDEEEGEDPRAELVRKLLEYQAFKEAAKELGILESERAKEFTRQLADYYFKDLDQEVVRSQPFDASMGDLLQAFHKVLKAATRENLHEVFEQIISIDEKIELIRRLIQSQREIYFTDLFGEKATRNELIVTFLAVLEVAKQKIAHIFQEKMFDEIRIVKEG